MARGTKKKKEKNYGRTKFPKDRLVGPNGMKYVVNGQILDEHVTTEEADELLRTDRLSREMMLSMYWAKVGVGCRSLARSP
jgi:hypothetical protein